MLILLGFGYLEFNGKNSIKFSNLKTPVSLLFGKQTVNISPLLYIPMYTLQMYQAILWWVYTLKDEKLWKNNVL